MRVELFGLGGRERSGSFGAVGRGLEDLEAPSRSLLVPVSGTLRQLQAPGICSLPCLIGC